MLTTLSKRDRPSTRGQTGMTLIEVLVSFAISLFTIAGIVSGYIYSVGCAQRFSSEQAASTLAMERLEQTRCAQWVTSVSPGIDQLQSSNFLPQAVTLDMSGNELFSTIATNIVTITTISTSPPLRSVHVDCVWFYGPYGTPMTNSIETIRSPE